MAFSRYFRRRTDHSIAVTPSLEPPTPADVRKAYERGRRDALHDRRRHPVGMTFLFLAAAVGIAVLGYAAYSGSFSRGGERLDQDLAVATDRAEPMVRDAADGAGQAVRDAGRSLTTEERTAPKAE